MTDPISAIRERLRKTGAPQSEHDAFEGLVVARDELTEPLSELLVVMDEHFSEFDVEGDECKSETLCPKCRENGCIQMKIRAARAALTKHKPAE